MYRIRVSTNKVSSAVLCTHESELAHYNQDFLPQNSDGYFHTDVITHHDCEILMALISGISKHTSQISTPSTGINNSDQLMRKLYPIIGIVILVKFLMIFHLLGLNVKVLSYGNFAPTLFFSPYMCIRVYEYIFSYAFIVTWKNSFFSFVWTVVTVLKIILCGFVFSLGLCC